MATKTRFVSTEQAAQDAIERSLKEAQEEHINVPTIRYSVGDRVQHGNIKESYVTEVLNDGKIIKLHEIVTENNYSRPYDFERDIYLPWHRVTPYADKEQWPTQLSFTDAFHLNYMQQSVFSIFTVYYSFGLDMSPDYQRGNIWSDDDKIKLIDSMFNNVDIGKFVFIRRDYQPDTQLYECLDGKQRVTALVGFYEGRFRYKGLLYREMHPHDQNHFESYPVSVAQVSSMTPADKYKYFLRLNTGGKVVDPDHIAFVQKLYEDEQHRLASK